MREVLNILNLLPVFLFQIMLRIPGTSVIDSLGFFQFWRFLGLGCIPDLQ